MAVEASRMWETLSAELGADLEFTRKGILGPASSEQDEAHARESARVAAEHGLSTRLLSASEMKALIPEMQGTWRAGLYTEDDAHGEAVKTTKAFARAAVAAGATLLEQVGVTRIEVTNGSVTAVHTTRGVIRSDVVVCAAGLGSAALIRSLGLALPIHGIRISVAETEPVPAFTRLAVWAPDVSFRPTGRGTFYVSSGYRSKTGDVDLTLDGIRFARQFLPQLRANPGALNVRVGRAMLRSFNRRVDPTPSAEPKVNNQIVDANFLRFRELFPHLGGLKLTRRWAGEIDATPDMIPVLGEMPGVSNLFVAAGYSGHGFALGPITGKILSDLVATGHCALDIRPFRLTRFAEDDFQLAHHAY
jgi:glycine/D-amino acid oxidase-like deaminating enzyme